MLILQALFLWLIISTLMLGGAMVFHRQFPEESPWFGWIVPPLGLVILLNFIEHGVALPGLVFLLPLMLGGTVWLIVVKGWFTKSLYLPSFVFLAAFAFTFGVRCLRPDISHTSDGLSDLNMVNNFSQGQTLPPPDTWLPPFRFEWYYSLQHYAASVLERLLNVKVGVGYNVAHALLSALICVAGAGAAHRISGGRTWVALAVPLLIESAATGSAAYLFLTCSNPSPWLTSDLSGGMTLPHPDNNPIWTNPIWNVLLWDPRPEIHHLATPETLRLQVPGFWTWRDEYHANASGHFLSLLSVLIVAELVYERRTIWPWVLAGLVPLLAVTASAWALPITVLLCWCIVPIALFYNRRPDSIGFTFLFLLIALTLLWPAFYNATSSPQFPEIMWTKPEWRAPLLEFLIQWWPILMLWICGCVCFRQVSFGVRWIMFVVPIMLIGIEFITIESRYNTIEKMWGYTWGAGLVGLFPFMAARAGVVWKILTYTLLVSALISLSGFAKDMAGGVWAGRYVDGVQHHLDGVFQLEGDYYITVEDGQRKNNDQKAKMLHILTQVKHATFLSGKSDWCYNESPALATFTGNRSYSAWYWFESVANYGSEADYRSKLNNDFYSGAMTNRLQFLKDNTITGVLIWPGDNIPDDVLGNLRKEIEPAYEYIDCRGEGDKNAGVFLARPLPVN